MGYIRRKISTDSGSEITLSCVDNYVDICLSSGEEWIDVELTNDEAKQLIQLIKETMDEKENYHGTERLSGGIDKGT